MERYGDTAAIGTNGWEGIEAKHCPICGRELEQAQPLTLDELKQMVGKPVYFMSSYRSQWAIVERYDNGYVTFTDGNYYNLDDYGQRWLAYCRKPE